VDTTIKATKAVAAHQQPGRDPANLTGECRVSQGLAKDAAGPTAFKAAAVQLPLADVLQTQGEDSMSEYIAELQENNKRIREELVQKKQQLQQADLAAVTANKCQKAAELAAQQAKEDCISAQLALHQAQKDKAAALLARSEAQAERREAQVAAAMAQEKQRQAESAAERMQEEKAAAELAAKQMQQQTTLTGVIDHIADMNPSSRRVNALQLIALEYNSSSSSSSS